MGLSTKVWDPKRYSCRGLSWDGNGNRVHAKGCAKHRPLRYDPGVAYVYSVECTLTFLPARQEKLVRCIPRDGVAFE